MKQVSSSHGGRWAISRSRPHWGFYQQVISFRHFSLVNVVEGFHCSVDVLYVSESCASRFSTCHPKGWLELPQHCRVMIDLCQFLCLSLIMGSQNYLPSMQCERL